MGLLFIVMKNLLFIVIFLSVSIYVDAQSRIFNRKQNKIEKATRDLEKRKKAAGEVEPFGSMSIKSTDRDDFIWSANSAYSAYKANGNVSFTEYSRLGISKNSELQTNLAADFWMPNLFLKHNWYKKSFYISSRHGIYSSTPGLNWAQKQGHYDIVDSLVNIPIITSFKTELIFSLPLWDNSICNTKTEYIILTAAFAADYGIRLNNGDDFLLDYPFISNRNPVMVGEGLLFTPRLQMDGRLTNRLYLRANAKYLFGDIAYNAIEQQTFVEYILFRYITVSGGYIFSYSKNSKYKTVIYPTADITFYFGKKPSKKQGGLFGRKMF